MGLDPKELIKTVFDVNLDPSRRMMERIWFRNILYYMGEQWIEWITNTGTFQKKYKYQPYLPTPVSNIIRDYIRTMRAMVLGKEFTIKIWPNSDNLDDKEAALIGENLLRDMDLADDESFEDEKEFAADMMFLLGTSFLRTFPDMESGWGFKGGVPKGAVATECLLTFNVFVDPLGKTIRRKRYVGVKSLKPREWVEDTFGTKVSAGSESSSINYEKRLMRIVSSVSPWKSSGIDQQLFEMVDDDLVVFKELEFRPTKEHPEGRYVVAVGDTILKEYKRLPIPVEDGRWHYTLTDFHYNRIFGRYWSDGGAQDLISPQNTINEIDQALIMNRKGIGRPLVLVPDDVELSRMDSYGQSLMILKYDAWLSGGKAPVVAHGTPLPELVLKERELHRTSFQDASGNPKDILSGKAPTSQASGIMVDILRNAAEQSHQPDIARYFRGLKRVYRKRLILAKELYTDERMIKVSGKGSEISVTAFRGADLRGNTDVRLELASGISTTNTGKTQTLMKLVEGGWFGDLSQDPETRHELLRKVGLSGFKDKTSIDVERAEKENAIIALADEGDIPLIGDAPVIGGIFLTSLEPETGAPGVDGKILSDDPLFKYDNHAVHYETHRREILSREFGDWNPLAQAVLITHTDIHHMLMMAEQQAMGRMKEEQEADESGSETGGVPAGGAIV